MLPQALWSKCIGPSTMVQALWSHDAMAPVLWLWSHSAMVPVQWFQLYGPTALLPQCYGPIVLCSQHYGLKVIWSQCYGPSAMVP